MKGIATLQIGSALGSSLLGVLFALVFMRKNGSGEPLKVNIQSASSPARYFFTHCYRNPALVEVVDLPTCMKKVLGKDHPSTEGLEGEELFFSPHIPSYSYHETDFLPASLMAREFWVGIQTPLHAETYDICAHIRRGDKLIYEPEIKVHTLEEYAARIAEHITPSGKICILTDDHRTFLDFTKLQPDWNVTTTSSPSHRGFNISEINQAPEEAVRQEVERMLGDYECIRRSRFFIGTRSSNIGYISMLLRGGKDSLLLS